MRHLGNYVTFKVLLPLSDELFKRPRHGLIGNWKS
jgi:hypothetical protein